MKIQTILGIIIGLLVITNIFTLYIVREQEQNIEEIKVIITEYQELAENMSTTSQECSDGWKETLNNWVVCEKVLAQLQ